MPLVLILLLRRARSLTVIGVTLAFAAVVSTLEMAVLYQHGASLDRLYYGTDTRAAELLVGCVLAVILQRRPLARSEPRSAGASGRPGGVVALVARGMGLLPLRPHQLDALARWVPRLLVAGGRPHRQRARSTPGPVAWILASQPARRDRPHLLRPVPVPLADLPLARRESDAPLALAPARPPVAVTAALALVSYHLARDADPEPLAADHPGAPALGGARVGGADRGGRRRGRDARRPGPSSVASSRRSGGRRCRVPTIGSTCW